ncbi:hypothetical protein ACLB2K_066995 [Fragaria x ananassa]
MRWLPKKSKKVLILLGLIVTPLMDNLGILAGAQMYKTYLLRIINAVMNAELYFAIAEHTLTVVGMDGSYVKPIVTDFVMISTGQTMDILVTSKIQPASWLILHGWKTI